MPRARLARISPIDNTTLCAHCQRCGRRSILGQADARIANDAVPQDAARLRCDMCGGRRVKLFRAQGPIEILAFINGRM